MSPEIIQIVLPLTFIGICGLIGEILVQCHRDKAAQERLKVSATRKEGPHATHQVRKTAAKRVL